MPKSEAFSSDIMGDAKALEKKLGRNDQIKLAEYLASVRVTELRVQRQVVWIHVAQTRKWMPPGLQLNSEPGDAHDRRMWLDVTLEISDLAFLTCRHHPGHHI